MKNKLIITLIFIVIALCATTFAQLFEPTPVVTFTWCEGEGNEGTVVESGDVAVTVAAFEAEGCVVPTPLHVYDANGGQYYAITATRIEVK